MKSFIQSILALLIIVSLTLACNNEDENPEVTEEEETETETIESWVLVNTDSFFVASAQALPGSGNPYRYQINFATRDQLSQTNNDGETESTFAIQLAFANRPSVSGTYDFTNDRFGIGDSDLNLYQTWFINTGHSNASKNFLSQNGSSVNITIENNKLSSALDSHVLYNEADDTETLTLKWQFELDW